MLHSQVIINNFLHISITGGLNKEGVSNSIVLEKPMVHVGEVECPNSIMVNEVSPTRSPTTLHWLQCTLINRNRDALGTQVMGRSFFIIVLLTRQTVTSLFTGILLGIIHALWSALMMVGDTLNVTARLLIADRDTCSTVCKMFMTTRLIKG